MYNIPEFYDELCESFDESWLACGWDSEESQHVRFVLLSSVISNNSSVLDIGCGQGDLFSHISKFNNNIKYCGIDFSKSMIEKAKVRFPNAIFENVDFFNYKSKFDFVVASGTFNIKVENQYEYIKKSINLCYECCNKCCSIALTSEFAENKYEEPIFYYDPKKILDIALEITPYVIINMASMPDEMILFMYKK